MLVLTRKADENVEIKNSAGEPVVFVKVISIDGNKVRLGFDADLQWQINRVRDKVGTRESFDLGGESGHTD